MAKYGIKITYSWGAEEDPAQYGTFDTPEKAYEKACEMAGREAYAQNEEMVPLKDCQIYFYGYKKEIDLLYLSDASTCKYKVVELPEEPKKVPTDKEKIDILMHLLANAIGELRDGSEDWYLDQGMDLIGTNEEELRSLGFKII